MPRMQPIPEVNHYFPLIRFPNELIIATASFLALPDLAKLLRTNNFLNRLLTPLAHEKIAEDPDRVLRFTANSDPPNESIFRLAVTKGANLQVSLTFDGKPALCFAATNGWDETVSLLLSLGPRACVGSTQQPGITALHMAAAAGHESTVLRLLDGGFDVSCSSQAGAQPLHLAACSNRLSVAKLLLSRGADINARIHQDTVVHLAIQRKHTAMVQFLLDSGIKMTTDDLGRCLYLSANIGNVELCQLLLTHGADPNAHSPVHFTMQGSTEPILHAAVCRERWPVVELLLRHPDIDVNARDTIGRTALFHAVLASDSKSAVELLVQRGADVNARNDLGMTALIWQAAQPNDVDLCVAEILLNAGAEVDAKDSEGCTALLNAVCYDHVALADMLLSHGADVTMRTPYGKTLLHEASADMVRVLLQHGADIAERMEAGRTALHGAVELGDIHAVRALLERGVDINARAAVDLTHSNTDRRGRTALYLAVRLGFVGIVKVLLKAGADVDAVYHVGSERWIIRTEVCMRMRKVFDEMGVKTVIIGEGKELESEEEIIGEEDYDWNDDTSGQMGVRWRS